MKKVCCQAEIHNSYLILMTYVLSKYKITLKQRKFKKSSRPYIDNPVPF